MAVVEERPVSMSGMTEKEAQEFHGIFVTSFILFTIVAIVAHVLVWMWRPWLPGPEGYTDALSTVNHTITVASSAITALIG